MIPLKGFLWCDVVDCRETMVASYCAFEGIPMEEKMDACRITPMMT